MSDSTPKFVHLSESDARDVLFAEMLEKRAGGDGRWSAGTRDAATRDAKRLAGEGVCARDFLPLRARLVAARLHEDPANAFGTTSFRRASLALTVILGLAALMSGMLTDHLATEGARINLLSPPLLLLIVWNLAVYLLIILKPLMPSGISRRPLSVREFLSRSLLKAAGSSAVSVEAGTALFLPQCRWLVARALHIAAILFASGLLAGMAVRGIGTAYSAGWESTWFADRPDIIAKLLNALYGWLPSFLPGISALPGEGALSAMNLAAGGSAPGADWLARMIWSLFILIILPRAAFAAACLWRARKEARRLRVPLDDGELDRLLQDGKPRTIKTFVVTDASDRALPEIDGPFRKLIVNPWEAPDFTTLSDAGISPGDRVLLVLDPTATPEEEVHGALIHALTMRTPNVNLSLDFSQLSTRFSETPERLQSRRALWEHFASENGVQLRITGLAPAA